MVYLNTWINDEENSINFYCNTFKNVETGEVRCFVIYDEELDLSDDLQQVVSQDIYEYADFLIYLRNTRGTIVTFNGLAYDYPKMHYVYSLIDNEKILESTEYVLELLWKKTQDIIVKDGTPGQKQNWNSIQERYHHVNVIDLFKIGHFDSSSRRSSLKRLQNNMRWHNVQSLPYKPDTPLTPPQVVEMLKYNIYNDIPSTEQLFYIFRGDLQRVKVDFPGLTQWYSADRIEFRRIISEQFGFNATNMSDVKMGEEVNKSIYLLHSGKQWKDIKDKKTHRDYIPISEIIPYYINFKSKPLLDVLEELKQTTINVGSPSFGKEFVYANNKWKIGLGGIHTEDTGRIVEPIQKHILCERDIQSMYPSKILSTMMKICFDNAEWNTLLNRGDTVQLFNKEIKIIKLEDIIKYGGIYPEHLGHEWLDGYRYIRDERLKIKPLAKKDVNYKLKSEVYKLALNGGGYGKTGDIFNWQYDPLLMYTVTIQCQLDILMLTDMLWTSGVIESIESGNTDGINIIYKEENQHKVEEICKLWEFITKLEIETTYYSKVIRTTVNDYMAIKTDGTIKRKGDFEIDKELHKDTGMHIVRVAIDNYYTKNIPIEQTIRSGTNILDYTKLCRIQATPAGSWVAQLHHIVDGKKQITDLPKDIRYYIEETGQQNILKYCYDGKSKGKQINLEAGYSCIPYNIHIPKNIKEYRINYNYYIKEAKKIINSVDDGQLTLF